MFLKSTIMFIFISSILFIYTGIASGFTLGVIGKQNVNLLEGDTNATLSCPVIGAKTAITYKWTFNGELISISREPTASRFVIQSDFLMIKTALRIMHGEFVARVSDATGASAQCSFSVQILYGPTFTSLSNKLVSAQAGDNVTLACTVDGNPSPVVYWLKDSRQLGYTNNVQMAGGILNFRSISVYDIGRYQCNATNAYGSVVSDIISVKVGVQLSIADVPENPLTLTQGGSPRLVCNFTGYPKPIITWYKNNIQLRTNDRFSIVNGFSKQNAWAVLTFKGVKMSDAGEYRCMAVQDQGPPISHTFRVTVAIPPTIISVHVRERSIQVGLPVMMTCKASGTPEPTYTWYHEQQEIIIGYHYQWGPDGGDLIIPRTLPEDEGTYSCTASNPGGIAKSATTFLTVEGLKFRVKPPDHVNIVVGDSQDILCQVEGNTNVLKIGWYKGIQRILQCGEKYVGNAIFKFPSTKPCSVYADHGTLHLRNLQRSHRGNYTCRVTEVGVPIVLEATTVINVVQPVVFIKAPPSVLEEDNHGTVTLECQVRGNPPPEIVWLKNGNQMAQTGRHRINGGKLTLTHLHVSDSATYTCFASNMESQGSRECLVHVRTPPGILNITITPGHMQAEVFWQVKDSGGYDITSVSLEYRQVDETGWRIMKDVSSSKQHTYKITHLKPISKYELNIWASNKLGNGVVSSHHFVTLRDQQDASGHYKNTAKGFIILGAVLCVFLCLAVIGFFYFYQRKGKSCFVSGGITTLREDTRILVKHQHSLHEPHQHANPAFDPNMTANESVEMNDVKKNHTKVHTNLKENKKSKSSLRKEQTQAKKKLEVDGVDNMMVETEMNEAGSPNQSRKVHFVEPEMNENNCNNTCKEDISDEYSTSSSEDTDNWSASDEYSSANEI